MAGPLIPQGTTPALPGQYYVLSDVSEALAPVVGIVAAVISADDGPLASWTDVKSIAKLKDRYGNGAGVEVVAEALRGGALGTKVFRAGTGGTKAAHTLQDTAGTPANAVVNTWKNVGIGGNSASETILDALDDATLREWTLFINGIKKQTVRFDKGSGGVGEPQALVNAINASNSPYVTSALAGAYTSAGKTLASVASPAAYTTGANPTVNSAAILAGMTSAEGISNAWNLLVFETEDTAAIQPAIVAQAALWEARGIYRQFVLGDPISVTASTVTRRGRARAYNQANLIYAIDQFTDTTGALVEGSQFAGRIAGMEAVSGKRHVITGRPVAGAVGLPTPLSQDELIDSTADGAVTLMLNDRLKVVVTSGVDTFVTPTSQRSSRWGKIIRVQRRYGLLIDASAAVNDALYSGLGIENDDDGRNALVGVVQGVIDQYKALKYLRAGTVIVDPDNLSVDDLAYLAMDITDGDQVERLVIAVKFP